MNPEWRQRREVQRREVQPRALSAWGAFRAFAVSGRLASYLSVLVSASALIFAISAFSNWRTQESSKRKSETAMSLLRSTLIARQCVDEGSYHFGYSAVKIDEFRELLKQGAAKMAECRPKISEMLVDVWVAESVLDSETYRAALNMYQYMFRMSKVYDHFRDIERIIESENIWGSGKKKTMSDVLDETGLSAAEHGYALIRSEIEMPFPGLYGRSKTLEDRLRGYTHFR